MELQRFLHDQGYCPRMKETPDGYTGYFGDLTKEALQAWQEDYHLTADGQFGQSCRQTVAQIQVGLVTACGNQACTACSSKGLYDWVETRQASSLLGSPICNMHTAFLASLQNLPKPFPMYMIGRPTRSVAGLTADVFLPIAFDLLSHIATILLRC